MAYILREYGWSFVVVCWNGPSNQPYIFSACLAKPVCDPLARVTYVHLSPFFLVILFCYKADRRQLSILSTLVPRQREIQSIGSSQVLGMLGW